MISSTTPMELISSPLLLLGVSISSFVILSILYLTYEYVRDRGLPPGTLDLHHCFALVLTVNAA